MALFTKDTIDRVRDAVDMVHLVGEKTDLRRVGTRWTGLCPFHDERTPSFSVNAEEKLYYCFGCGEGGDAFKFVQQTEALEFQEAVELLAERFNVRAEREEDDPRAEQRRRRRERLHALLDRAASFYSAYLVKAGEAQAARDYLRSRGLSDEVLTEFRVGYSPSAWDRMLLGARESGFTEEELIAAGLAQRGRSGGLYDRFRGRIMFPLADARGKVLGFGARQMGEDRGPKYLNTSENDLYHKGRQLFGIDVARKEAMKSARFVVVEGYTDVLALHQAGIREAVAIMGTAMTQEQLAELAKVGDSNRRGAVYLALDADRAGRDAMLRAARLAEDRGVDLRVIDMPEGTDPAELVNSEGAASFTERMDRAAPMIEFQVRRVLADADLDTPSGRDKALGEARNLISAVPDRTATRDALVREAADRLDVPVDYVMAPTAPVAASAPAMPAQASPGELALRAEREFLTRCLSSNGLGRDYLSRPADDQFSSDLLRRARDHLVLHFDDPLAAIPEDDPALGALVTDVALAALERPPTGELVLRMSILQLEQRRIDREIRRATQDGDHSRKSELAAAEQRVRDELGTVMGQSA
ncbi:MAG: primase [Thermoleophilaceae bacterium]|jgi:DNA primase|nr:primase [Thermoleophilaceae bacterium]